ncbi:hypothetical protein [Variovorax sp. PAMC 28711]|uniref:hypothetical protein n=1 Tax=Variovorax sp. PAMC 28711 TaxID=1795631 RepID=UPI00078B542B|nr:hypothetical protein [Variovorax sp. PAMC 28711]AMM24337.1 hypothetical protein AX767_08230 [Variovorax sp. PAMC 28711]
MQLSSPSRRERGLFFAFLLLSGVAVLGPALTGVHAGASLFADDRAWHHLPNAMDVLSNLPFLAVGLWGLRWLGRFHRRAAHGLPASTLACAWLFFAGFLACTAGSVFYHLQPDLLRLAADRAGMTIAFAGLIGFAVCERVSHRAGPVAACATLVGGLLAVAVWHETGNVAPWAVVQFGGMALVVSLALAKPMRGAVDLKLGWVIFFYALAKGFELGDHAIYEATHHLVSGHSLKHLTAALAGLPVLHALQTFGRQSLRHNPGAAALTA